MDKQLASSQSNLAAHMPTNWGWRGLQQLVRIVTLRALLLQFLFVALLFEYVVRGDPGHGSRVSKSVVNSATMPDSCGGDGVMVKQPILHITGTLKVATMNMWADSSSLLEELWILPWLFENAVGKVLIPLPPAEPMENAEVIILGPFGSRTAAQQVANAHSQHAMIIFILGENADANQGAFYDGMVDFVHLSFGPRLHVTAPSYLRFPWWIPYVLKPQCGCTFPAEFHALGDAGAWTERSGYATILSRHIPYPRAHLFDILGKLGYGRVDAPSIAFHNMEWPHELSNSHVGDGKIKFLQNYRYNICPENSKSVDGGYITEKFPQALMAGAIPIYWGDAPEPTIFNSQRIIVFDGTNESVERVVNSLERNATFRQEWFQRPILTEHADRSLQLWCNSIINRIRSVLQTG